MRRALAALLIGVAGPAAALAGPAAAASTDAAVAALALPEPQFRQMLASVVFTAQTMGMAAFNLGIRGNCAAVRPAFDQAIARHLPVWQANLVKAYRDQVPGDTLDKAATAGAVGGGRLILPFRDKIGAQMQAASTPLLKVAAAEVLEPVWNAASKVDFKAIDGDKRLAEMRAAKADGSLFCGLMPTTGGARRIDTTRVIS